MLVSRLSLPLALAAFLAVSVTVSPPASGQDEEEEVDARARIEGRWRVVTTPRDPDRGVEFRATWRTRPNCASGPCGFVARSNVARQRFAFRFDRPLGDYIERSRGYDNCVDLDGREIAVRNAYLTRRATTLTVSKSVLGSDGVSRATEFDALIVHRYQLRRRARGKCPRVPPLRFDVRGIRVDTPE
jgi:hypothetical protein